MKDRNDWTIKIGLLNRNSSETFLSHKEQINILSLIIPLFSYSLIFFN